MAKAVDSPALQPQSSNLQRPSGEGSEILRVYFKGLVIKQLAKGYFSGGIGVAICDSRNDLLFELRKPCLVKGMNVNIMEIRALIKGLNAALELQLQRLVFYCSSCAVFNYVTGYWSSNQRETSILINEVTRLAKKFTYCQPSLAARSDIKFVYKLAREASFCAPSEIVEASYSLNYKKTCNICLEESNNCQIFYVDYCWHGYCFSCMKQHVEWQLLYGLLPTCPHEKCTSKLRVDSCRTFLTPRLTEIMTQRLKEASIPAKEKVYCAYPKCSALMSKMEAIENSRSVSAGAKIAGARRCIKCNGHFCVYCKVPWHNRMTCFQYRRKNPRPQEEEEDLKKLAATNLWRQCEKCNHLIEFVSGCYHMTCRCGYEFCYTCGAEWKDKKKRCSCPLWDEENILEDDQDSEEDEDESSDSDSDDE